MTDKIIGVRPSFIYIIQYHNLVLVLTIYFQAYVTTNQYLHIIQKRFYNVKTKALLSISFILIFIRYWKSWTFKKDQNKTELKGWSKIQMF